MLVFRLPLFSIGEYCIMATGVVGFLFINAEESASLGGVLKDFGASGIFR